MHFKTVTIIGTGLLGGSLALDLRRLKLVSKIIGVCRSEATAKQALEKNIVDQVLPLDQATKLSDLIVVATPMQSMLSVLKQIANVLPKHTIVTDVGSVKHSLYQQVRKEVPEILPQFVLGHPIAGGESSGVNSARTQLFENKHLVLTPSEEVDLELVEQVAAMWENLGSKVLKMTVEQHDAIFAKTSHLPHVIAFSLVNYLHNQEDRNRLFDLAAAGFYDFTRIASSDAVMWRDICATNRSQVVEALDGFMGQVKIIRDSIESDDQGEVLEYFNDAKAARDEGLLKKAEQMGQNKG